VDYEEYRRAFFTDPAPQPRFRFASTGGAVMFIEDYEAAVAFYQEVLGQPAYAEGAGTRGWQIGDSWLTLFPAGDGGPRNTEIGLLMETPAEADRLQAAFIAAGATGPEPSDQLMYEPIRSCPVTDPFGTRLLIYARR
jgi:catechol 2,3-dioxygenase-like lactoylglutathione lyase family enzyme